MWTQVEALVAEKRYFAGHGGHFGGPNGFRAGQLEASEALVGARKVAELGED